MFVRRGGLDRTENTQPALFALEVALFRLLESSASRPDFVIGHSVGELAAAHVAGRAVAARTRPRWCGARPADAGAAGGRGDGRGRGDRGRGLRAARTGLSTSPRSTGRVRSCVAGTRPADRASSNRRAARRRGCRSVTRSTRALMDPMLDEFRAVVEGLTFDPPRLAVVSNLTGELAGDEIATPGLLGPPRPRGRPLRRRRPQRSTGSASTRFLEVGPGRRADARWRARCIDGTPVAPALRAGPRRSRETFADLIAARPAHRARRRLARVATPARARASTCPTYAFQHQHYWLTGDRRPRPTGLDHPLLSARCSSRARTAGCSPAGCRSPPSRGSPTTRSSAPCCCPAPAFVELALAAGEQIGCPVVDELTLEAPLVLPEQGSLELQVVVGERRGAARSASAPARAGDDDAPWVRHAAGVLAAG